jgi:hypothetical protein
MRGVSFMFSCHVCVTANIVQNGWTALLLTALAGHVDCARLLLDAGADQNVKHDVRYSEVFTLMLIHHDTSFHSSRRALGLHVFLVISFLRAAFTCKRRCRGSVSMNVRCKNLICFIQDHIQYNQHARSCGFLCS